MHGTPVFLGCSDIDDHIPAARVHESGEVFRAMGAPPESLERLIDDLDAARAATSSAGPARERQGSPPEPETPPLSGPVRPGELLPIDAVRRR